MTNTEFQREVKEDKPVIALCYDFDKTLSPDDGTGLYSKSSKEQR